MLRVAGVARLVVWSRSSHPSRNRTYVRLREGWDERDHTTNRATPATRSIPGHRGLPGDTTAATPRLSAGRTPRGGPPPAATTHRTSPAHAAGLSRTARRALNGLTAPTRRGHHPRASGRPAQPSSPAPVTGVVLRHRLDRRPRAAMEHPPRHQKAGMDRRPGGWRRPTRGLAAGTASTTQPTPTPAQD